MRSIPGIISRLSRDESIPASKFLSALVLPQLFLIVVFLVLGALIREPTNAVAQKLLVGGYLFSVGWLLRAKLARIRIRLVVLYLASLQLIIILSGFILRTDLLLTVLIPVALMGALSARLPISRRGHIILGGLAAFAIVFLLAVTALLLKMGLISAPPAYLGDFVTVGVYLLTGLLVLYLVRILWNPAIESKLEDYDGSLAPHLEEHATAHRTRPPSSDPPEFISAARSLLEVVRAAYSIRITAGALGALLLSGLCALNGVLADGVDSGTILVLSIGLLICAIRGVSKAQNLGALYRAGFFGSLVIVLLLSSYILFANKLPLGSVLLLGIFVFVVCTIPARAPYLLAISGVTTLVGVLLMAFGLLAPVMLALISVASFTGALVGTLTFRSTVGGVGMRGLSLLGQQLIPVKAMMRVFAWYLRVMCGSVRALIILGERRQDGFSIDIAETIDEHRAVSSEEDPIFARGFLQAADDFLNNVAPKHGENRSGYQIALMPFSILGDQFVLPFLTWFGTVPYGLIVIRIPIPGPTKNEVGFIAMPLSSWEFLLGRRGLVGGLKAKAADLAGIVNMYFASALLKAVRDDELMRTQQIASQRDEELSEVVHLVNNCVQELTLIVDQGSDSTVKPDGLSEQLANTVSVLGSSVSDIRLMRELTLLEENGKRVVCGVHGLLPPIKSYGEYLARRRGAKFELRNEVSEDAGILVANADLAGTVFRTLLGFAFAKCQRGGQVRLTIRSSDKWICIDIEDNGPHHYSEIFGIEDDNSTAKNLLDPINQQRVAGIKRFVELSYGSLEIAKDQAELQNRASVVLEAEPVKRGAEPSGLQKQWVLLVEDSEEIRGFYARVAEALELEYAAAESLTAARAKLQQRGRPDLIVTDVQLGDGTGIDLLREVYAKFGNGIPVIVVSGEAKTVGADILKLENSDSSESLVRFLMKPVGRKRLFDEISLLLARVRSGIEAVD